MTRLNSLYYTTFSGTWYNPQDSRDLLPEKLSWYLLESGEFKLQDSSEILRQLPLSDFRRTSA